MLQTLPVGNAVRVFITPPAGAQIWRVLRRTADAFTGPNDVGAVVVVDESTDNVVLDVTALENGTEYFYRDYSTTNGGVTWADSGASLSTTPVADYQGDDIDAQELVRDRLILGMAVEVQRGALVPSTGKIPVVTAPFALMDGITFPCVSVHMDSTGPAERALGEDVLNEFVDHETGAISEAEGWLARWRIGVVGVSLNPDERIALRKAIRRVIQANLGVFDNAGLIQIQFSQSDSEENLGDNARLYRTDGVFECLSPAFVTDAGPVVVDVGQHVNVFGQDEIDG